MGFFTQCDQSQRRGIARRFDLRGERAAGVVTVASRTTTCLLLGRDSAWPIRRFPKTVLRMGLGVSYDKPGRQQTACRFPPALKKSIALPLMAIQRI